MNKSRNHYSFILSSFNIDAMSYRKQPTLSYLDSLECFLGFMSAGRRKDEVSDECMLHLLCRPMAGGRARPPLTPLPLNPPPSPGSASRSTDSTSSIVLWMSNDIRLSMSDGGSATGAAPPAGKPHHRKIDLGLLNVS